MFKDALKVDNLPKFAHKRTLAPVTAAEIKRLLEKAKTPGTPYLKERLWLSSIAYTNPTDFVLNYHKPAPFSMAWTGDLHTKCGDVIHDYIQQALHKMGVLFPQYSGKYEEVRIENKEFRISGRIDGLLAKEATKALGAKVGKEVPDTSELIHLEIKSISADLYKEIRTSADIKYAYRVQAACTQKIIDKPGTLFLFVNKSDMTLKTIWYEGEDYIWEQTKELSRTIFTAIENNTLPLPEGRTEEDILGMSFAQWLENVDREKQEWEKWVK